MNLKDQLIKILNDGIETLSAEEQNILVDSINRLGKFNQEEKVIIHNAVIFMANDLMEEIQELEAYVKDRESMGVVFPDKEEHLKDLAEKNRRWSVMTNITEKIK